MANFDFDVSEPLYSLQEADIIDWPQIFGVDGGKFVRVDDYVAVGPWQPHTIFERRVTHAGLWYFIREDLKATGEDITGRQPDDAGFFDLSQTEIPYTFDAAGNITNLQEAQENLNARMILCIIDKSDNYRQPTEADRLKTASLFRSVLVNSTEIICPDAEFFPKSSNAT